MDASTQLLYSNIYILLVALFCGFLVGLPQQKREKSHGARDHMFISMISALGVIFHSSFEDIGFFLFALVEISVFIFIILTTLYRMFRQEFPGYTTTLALLMSQTLGVLSVYDKPFAVISSVIFLIILSSKQQIHKIRNLSKVEWNSTIEYIALVVVFLILIPKDISLGNISLLSVFYIFVIILSLKYFSYFLLKLVSYNSVYYLSILGGFAHSEAVTTDLARLDAHPSSIMLVLQTMLIRILFIIIIARELFLIMIYPLMITATFGILFSRHYLKKHITEVNLTSIKNPISIKSAMIFSMTYLSAVIATLISSEITKNYSLTPIFYYILSLVIGALSGGSATLFATTAFINNLVDLNTAVYMIIFGLCTAVFNKLIYTWRNKTENTWGYYFRLITYQAITVIMLWLTTLLAMYFLL
ncbi:MAG: DUF4010 domain-containing protein [Promethearchaeota archaeon]